MLKDHGSVLEMDAGVAAYVWCSHHQRSPQALDDRTPAEVPCDHEQRKEADVC